MGESHAIVEAVAGSIRGNKGDIRTPAPMFFAEAGDPHARGALDRLMARHKEQGGHDEPDALRSYKDQFLNAFFENGFLEKDNEGRIVADIERFKTDTYFNDMRQHISGGGRFSRDLGQVETLAYVFGDTNVYSREDYARLKRGEFVEPKPLFYIPKNARAATDVNAIKAAKFHIGFWEVRKAKLPPAHPVRVLDAERPNAWSTTVAALVYHPGYGDAIRDKATGELLVRFGGERNERRRISSRFFESYGYRGAPGNRTSREHADLNPINSPGIFLSTRTPDLIEKGLIEPRDFRAFEFGAREKHGMGLRPLNNKYGGSLDGVKYQFSGKVIGEHESGYVTKLSDAYGAFVIKDANGQLRVHEVFKLLTPQDCSVTYRIRNNNFLFGHARLGEYTSFTRDKWSQIEPGIADVAQHFDTYYAHSTELSRVGVNISKLSPDNQRALLIAFQSYESSDIYTFGKRYGLVGIQAFLLAEQTTESGDAVLRLGALGKANTAELFHEAAQIGKTLDFMKYSSMELSLERQSAARQIDTEARLHATALLVAATSDAPPFDSIESVMLMRTFHTNLESYADSYFGKRRNTQGRYAKLLDQFALAQNDPHRQRAVLAGMRNEWNRQIVREAQDPRKIAHELAELDKFYAANAALYETANVTTGDTPQEQARLKAFFQKYRISGRVLDSGAGATADRMTGPMADMLQGKATVIGIDRQTPTISKQRQNLELVSGDATQLSYSDSHFDVIVENWSPDSDFRSRIRRDQRLTEYARVLRPGGYLYYDVPHLEGGEGSWMREAQSYHADHPDEPYGTIDVTFPGDRRKHFFIAPDDVRRAELTMHGFTVVEEIAWKTKAGKTRKAIIARLDQKQTAFNL